MVELTDWTLCQAAGDFGETCRIMQKESNGSWMLKSTVYVSSPFITARYVMHFWDDGHIVIFDSDHSLEVGASDDDLREFNNWYQKNGWKSLVLDNRLLADRSNEWWYRAFLAGLIKSDYFKNKEDAEMKRLSKAFYKEE